MAIWWHTASEDDIIQHCSRTNPIREFLDEPTGGRCIIRISEHAVVKCGMFVTYSEAINQQRAYETLNPDIVRVPQVYRFFNRGFKGYLIMEHTSGQPLSSVKDPDTYLEPIATALKLFEQVQRDKPGPFYEGCAVGHLWLDSDPITPSSVSEIEEYYNERHLKNSTPLNLSGYPLVLCHLNIAPRNIMVLEDGSLCLTDWADAGFYPRLFERVVIRIQIQGKDDWHWSV